MLSACNCYWEGQGTALPSEQNICDGKQLRHSQYHTPTNALVYNVFKISLNSSTLKHSYCSDMFRQHIACHPQGALVILAKITINMNIPVV